MIIVKFADGETKEYDATSFKIKEDVVVLKKGFRKAGLISLAILREIEVKGEIK